MAKKEKLIKVTLTRSPIGYNHNQAKVLDALGLHKIGNSNMLPDNASVRGSLFVVRHLVTVEE
ncbi:MAG: 50S ribosomal protein L30 [Clostridia bacterium]